MAKGKQTCRILKEIRKQIAEANGIEFVTSECRYKGDCTGTCPKCEAEVHYLERQLHARTLAGKAVALAGISAGMIFMSGCGETTPKQAHATSPADAAIERTAKQAERTDSAKSESMGASDSAGVNEAEEPSLSERTPVFYLPDLDEVIEGEVTYPQEPPMFPNGSDALMQFIYSNMRFPAEWNEASINGSALVTIEVDKNGKVSNPEIVSISLEEEFIEEFKSEILRIIDLLPDFIPAKELGKPINCYYNIPIYLKSTDHN